MNTIHTIKNTFISLPKTAWILNVIILLSVCTASYFLGTNILIFAAVGILIFTAAVLTGWANSGRETTPFWKTPLPVDMRVFLFIFAGVSASVGISLELIPAYTEHSPVITLVLAVVITVDAIKVKKDDWGILYRNQIATVILLWLTMVLTAFASTTVTG